MTFEERFPEIEHLKGSVSQPGYFVTGLKASSLKNHMDMEVRCRNPSCSNGRLYLEPIVRELVRNQQTEYEDSELCLAKETGSGRDCLNHFEIKISITYKKSPAN